MSGEGNSYDFGARMYNNRIGKFLSLDPLSAINLDESNYAYAANNPIYFVDFEGKDNIVYLVVMPSDDAIQEKLNAQDIANEANEMYKTLGVKTRVVVFDESTRGEFNADYMDKTDSYAVVGTPKEINDRTGLPEHPGALENASSNGNKIGVDVGALDKYSVLPVKSKSQLVAFAIVHGSGHNAENEGSIVHGDKADRDLDWFNYVNFMSEGSVVVALFDKTGTGMYPSDDLRKTKSGKFIFAEDVQKNNPSVKEFMDLFDKKRNKTNIKNLKRRFGNNKSKDNYDKNKAKANGQRLENSEEHSR